MNGQLAPFRRTDRSPWEAIASLATLRQARNLRIVNELVGLDEDASGTANAARVRAIAYIPSSTFALGDEDQGAAYLRDYYAFTGPFAEQIAAGNLTSARAIKDFVRGYEEAGCDELILFPTVADIGQLERLAEVLA